MNNDPRYTDINAVNFPVCTRAEAGYAIKAIMAKFGRKSLGSVNQKFDVKWLRDPRRCWISLRPTSGHHRGWGRLIHDAAHIIFQARHPSFRPHDNGHAVLEREILIFCHEQQYFERSLLVGKRPMTTEEKRQKRLREIDAGVKRWTTKQIRATNALRKLKNERKRIERAIEKATEAVKPDRLHAQGMVDYMNGGAGG